MLEDYLGFEFTTAHIGTYKSLAIIFNGSTIFLIFFLLFSLSKDYTFLELFSNSSSFLIPLVILSGVTYYLYRLSRRYYMRLIGKFNFIDVQIQNPTHKSIKKFLEKVKVQSDIQKNK